MEINLKPLKLIECPRDAMQGWPHFIDTKDKIRYINSLLKVGFDTIDFGSFVSPKAIPQMADTRAVMEGLNFENVTTKLLAIVANLRGAEEAVLLKPVHYIGFPFSISPTFQQRNTNSTIEQSLVMVEQMQHLCLKNSKELVVYISMGFGNIYGDEYNEHIALNWIDKIASLGVKIISIADTVGLADANQISNLLNAVIPNYNSIEIGVHLHSLGSNWKPKVDAALAAGCRRFDGTLKGIGGCPMADDELVGNMDSELMIPYFNSLSLLNNLNEQALIESIRIAKEIFI